MNTIAIVIPYYKIDFFEETLKSVASQTDKRFTLYIGNDASSDDPFPLIEKYCPNRNYHYFDYRENLGGKNLAMQWERILENVKEEWFQILGDDDVISENFVEEFYRNLPEVEKNESNVVKIHQKRIDGNGKTLLEGKKFPSTFTRIDNWNSKFVHGEPASLSEHIFRMKKFRENGFRYFLLAWGTDDTAVFETSGPKPLYFLPNAYVKVRVSNISISGNEHLELEKKKAHYYFWQYIINNHYREFDSVYLQKMINYQINFSYINRLKLGLRLPQIYFYQRSFSKLLELPKIYHYLWKRHAKQTKED